jgi:hypothetical protein
MKSIGCIVMFFLLHQFSPAQQADFLVLKKKQHTIKSFFTGNHVNFLTAGRGYNGLVTAIKRDSVFMTEFDIRQVPTNLGVYVLDTIARYYVAFPVNEITGIAEDQRGFNWSASGASLLGGGILLTTIGAGTWIFTKPGTRYHAPVQLVIGSAILGGIGYFILKAHSSTYKFGKKYSLHYVSVNNNPK